jgi:hypothetical protein
MVDMHSAHAAPLMTALLLADEPGSQAMQQQWRDCVLADVL